MDDILLPGFNGDTLERMFDEVKRILFCWGFQIAPEKIQSGDCINYPVYKISLHEIRPQKFQNHREQLIILNDFQKILGGIN